MKADSAEQDDDFVSERMCLVTRETLPAEEMIRFVVAPDGAVTPDLKKTLPGRGCSIKAERALVEKAVRKGLFARAFKKEVKAGPELADLVDRLLVTHMTGMMNMARKSGKFLSGATRVDNAVRSGEALAVFHATDAAADGVRKIAQARKAWALTMEEEEPPVFQLLSYQEMQELLGDNAFIHAVALAGQAGEGVVKRAKLLDTYRGGSRPIASIE
ncbi:RNA-binding protein [Rhizobium sp. TRM95796]|uniref:RNA-binding protein n=1 Tax=Rhizobium sp. TRM95796 TaxID=2979862 RepID=UPI0021E758D9|nr:RNA-binding protein [Rhizobium sp. TRM95796]MCV3766896.1 RNA-binding protein [Rhizobium sp. TRM95796]